MEQEKVWKLQKIFTRFNRVIYIILLFYIIIQQFAAVQVKISKISMIGAIIISLIEYRLDYKNKQEISFYILLRYLQWSVSAIIFILAKESSLMGIGMILLFLFSVEYFLLFDFVESYYRIVYILSISIPLVIGCLIKGILKNSIDRDILILLLIVSLYCLVLFLFSSLFSAYIIEKNKQVFSKERQLETIAEVNEQLREHQEKIKKANEQLGIQKIELQTAYYEINRVNKEIRIQNDILKYISSSLEIGKLMILITDSILKEIGVDFCAIILYPGVVYNETVEYQIRTRYGKSFITVLSEIIQQKNLDNLVQENQTFVDNSVEEEKYPFFKEKIVHSFIIIPLVKENKRIGALMAGHSNYNYFKENISFFEGIVSQILIALNNASLYAQMESMAKRDGLTGIYNRAYLAKLLEEYIHEALLHQMPISVALFDIDKFKNVNDTYGHLFGDEVIRTIAELAKGFAKEYNGVIGRYGGEEFVVIYPNRILKDAYVPVKKMYKAIQEKKFSYKKEIVHISVSVGLTAYPEICKNPKDLLKRADWAMYYSKENGRNRITIDSDEINTLVCLK